MFPNNLSLFLANLALMLLILLIFKRSYPDKDYGIITILQSLMIGAFSVIVINIVHFVFPMMMIFKNSDFDIFIQAFFKISLVEEIAKYSAFVLICSQKKKFSPMDIVFYSVCDAASFAFIENFQYMQNIPMMSFNKLEAIELLLKRFCTAVVMHITCGFICGYSIVYAKTHGKNLIKYSIIGILSATFLHGLYDFNIMMKLEHLFQYNNDLFVASICSILGLSFLSCVYIFKRVGKMEIKV